MAAKQLETGNCNWPASEEDLKKMRSVQANEWPMLRANNCSALTVSNWLKLESRRAKEEEL